MISEGTINAEVLRDPLAVSGVVVANGYFQHHPASFAVLFCIIYRSLLLRKQSACRIRTFCGFLGGIPREVHCISLKKNAQAKRLRIVGIVGHPWVEPQKVLAEIKIE